MPLIPTSITTHSMLDRAWLSLATKQKDIDAILGMKRKSDSPPTIMIDSPPYPIYATDTYILNYTFLARSHSAKSSYEVERYRFYAGS